MKDTREHLILFSLECGVWLAFADFDEFGVPELTEKKRKELSESIFQYGEDLLFSGKYTSEAMTNLIDTIAILATCPGGVKFAGKRWEYFKEEVIGE